MKFYNYIIILVLTVSGCTDFLVENPKSYTVGDFKNERDATLSINGIYTLLRDDDVVGSTIKPVPTDLYKRATWSYNEGLGDYSYGADNNFFLLIWQKHYNIINACNNAIVRIEANKDSIPNSDRYIAQAKGVRAFLYFDLVRWFGDVPLVLTPTFEYNKANAEVTRAPQADVFNQIISDFTFCTTNSVSKGTVNSGYQYGSMTREAAHGFLAKVYLWMASVGERDNSTALGNPADNYQLALTHAKAVIDSKKFSLASFYPDLFTISTESTAQQEVLFCVQALRGDRTSSSTGMNFGIVGSTNAGGSYGTNISTNYHRMIYEPSDSIRRLWNCPRATINALGILSSFDYDYYLTTDTFHVLTRKTEKTNGLTYSIGKFRRYPIADPATYGIQDGMDEPLLRYADVLLIYAEAYNEVNKSPGAYAASMGKDFTGNSSMSAYDAVNIVRKRARTFNNGLVHQNAVPRAINLSKTDLVNSCVPDWKPGFYGTIYDGTTSVYENRLYSSDYQAFREEILWERGRELVAESNDRWCDLVRRNKLVTQIRALRFTINPFITKNENLSALDAPENIKPYMMVFPIPQGEIDVNRKLTQNPNY